MLSEAIGIAVAVDAAAFAAREGEPGEVESMASCLRFLFCFVLCAVFLLVGRSSILISVHGDLG